ncbi:MAG: hypothetical protein ACLFU6_05030 [Candidatus Hydrogenedentota bacterium]
MTKQGILIGLLLVGWACGADNLLRNGALDELEEDGMPAYWRLFVEPREGAYGGVDEAEAAEGDNSIMLHIEEPYTRDPANNWSQNVLEDLAGEELRVSAQIKTEKAGEAMVWVQAIRNQPWRILRTASTSERRVFSGTREWTEVSHTFRVPEKANYLVVRCVLRGSGRAWFDDLRLERLNSESAPADEEEEEEESPDIDQNAALTSEEPEEPSVEEPGPEEARGTRQDDEALVQALLDANQMLLETYQELRRTNETLVGRLETLESDLSAVRGEFEALEEEVRQISGSLEEPEPAHPESEPEPESGNDESGGPILKPKSDR